MESYKYKAFLSYSHAADAKLAPALQSSLQQFAKPWYRLRAIRIFRDSSNLSATPNLWNDILRALAESEFYIIMASPAASQSRWVRQEIGYWLDNRDPTKMIFVLTDGQVKWNPDVNDFDWSATTALPDSVRGLLKQEPLYLDFTWTRARNRLSSRDPEFQSRIASIAATLHGRPKDEIFGEDLRQHRKAMQIAWASVALLTFLAIVASSLGIMAYLNSVRLQQSLTELQAKQRDTRAGYLAGRSQFWLNEFPQLATLLAIESVNATKKFGQPVNPAAEQALRNSLATLGGEPVIGHSQPISALTILADGRLATASIDGTVRLQDPKELGTSVTILSGLSGRPDGIVVADDLRSIAVWGTQGIFWWDLTKSMDTPLRFAPPHKPEDKYDAEVSKVLIEPNGRIAALSRYGGKLLVWNCESPSSPPIEFTSRDEAFRLEWPLLQASPNGLLVGGTDSVVRVFDITRPNDPPRMVQEVESRFIESNDSRLVTVNRRGTIHVRDLANLDSAPLELLGALAQMDSLKILSESCLGAFYDNSTVNLWSMSEPKLIRTVHLGRREFGVGKIVLSPNNRWLASTETNGDVLVWDLSEDKPQMIKLKGHQKSIGHMVFTPSGFLVSASYDKTVRVWDLDNSKSPVRILRGHDGKLRDIRCLPDGRLITAGVDGTVRIWNLNRPVLAPACLQHAYLADLEMGGNGHVIGSLDQDGVVVWDLLNTKESPIPLAEPEDEKWTAFAMTAAGQLILGGSKGTIASWNPSESQKPPKSLARHTSGLRAIIVSYDGRFVALDETGKRLIWHVSNLASVPEPLDQTKAKLILRGSQKIEGLSSLLRFARDGRLAAGEASGDVYVWETDGQQLPVTTPRGDAYGSIIDIAWSPDGRLIVADQSPLVRVFDLANNNAVTQIHRGESQMGHRLKFLPDGRLAALDYFGAIRLWNLSSPGALPIQLPYLEPRNPPGPQLPGRLAIGSMNGRTHLVASSVSGVTMTTLDIDELLEYASHTVGRNLSKSEWNQNIQDESYRQTIAELPIPDDEENRWIGQMYN